MLKLVFLCNNILERELRKELIKLIPNPRPKSQKWISSLTTMKNDTSDESCTAAYLAKIMHASVNLKENFKNLQPNTIILDISPDSALVDILKDVDDKSNIFVGSLLQRNDNNLSIFLNTIGKYVQCKIINK